MTVVTVAIDIYRHFIYLVNMLSHTATVVSKQG